MAYTTKNYKSGKAIRDDFKAGEVIRCYQPGPFGPAVKDGPEVIEGPHYPEPHRFYIAVEVKNGVIVKIKK